MLGAMALILTSGTSLLAQQKAQAPATLQPQAEAKSNVAIRFADEKYTFSQRVDELFISDFSDGDEWTITAIDPDTAMWQITTQDTFLGTFTNTTFGGASVENGFAVINFDAASMGNTNTDTVLQLLESPAYDISSLDAGLTYELAFQTQLRTCCSFRQPGTKVSVSYDNGVTYSDPQTVARYNTTNAELNDVVGIRMPPMADTATQFRVRFQYDGFFYYWAVDDIRIRPLAERDIELSTDFAAVPPYLQVPQQQAGGSIPLLVDVFNRGNLTSTFEVVASVFEVVDGARGDVLSIDSLSYTSVVYDSLAENQIFPVQLPFPTEIGLYVLEYRVSFPDDLADTNPDDNVIQTAFEVTENVYSKTRGTINGRRSVNDDDGSIAYEVGNVYYYPNDRSGTWLDSVSFTQFNRGWTAEALAELEIDVTIYGTQGDLNNNGVAEPDDEIDFIATTSITLPEDFLGTDGDRRDLIAVFGEDNPVRLTEEFPAYAVTVTYNPPDVEGVGSFFVGSGEDFGAQGFAASTFDSTFVNSILRESLDEGATFSYTSLAGLAPVVRAHSTTRMDVSTREQLDNNQVSIAPNPANQYVDLRLELTAPAQRVRIDIVNALGQTMSTMTQSSVQSGRMRVPMANLPGGMYHVHVSIDGDRAASRTVLVSH